MQESFDPHHHQGPLPSPCISLCVMDPDSRLCQGCSRTIDEIIGWSAAGHERKRAIWIAIQERRRAA
ncbi:MAG: DUF1289 domain-containing protein [Herminiimonas sp.]|nr:DUF1289 domain-containing protein [Herminiimonas sp.]